MEKVDKIPPIPKFPQELLLAAKTKTLVLFIGAGVSVNAGCPSWKGFADACLDFLREKGCMLPTEATQIKQLNPKVGLAIARQISETKEVPIDFEKFFHKNENWRANQNGQRLYALISMLSTHQVTTN